MVDDGVVVALSLFLLLPSSLSSSPFGVVADAVAAVAPVAPVVTVILVAPAPVALAAFVVAFAVVATTFLAIDVSSKFDCCVPSLQEEDHRLPPPSGKVPSCRACRLCCHPRCHCHHVPRRLC